VLGHEGSGIIVETGAGVPQARVGERVVMDITSHCGECDNCRSWSLSRCENAVRSTGYYAELAKLPAQSAHRIPDDMSLELAALTEPASCCLAGVERMDIRSDMSAVVIGGGIMGLLTLAYLRRAGIGGTLLSEPVALRRNAALEVGADRVHDPEDGPLEEAVREFTAGKGVHLAVEAVGKPELVAACARMIRPKGDLLMIGVCPQGAPLPIDLYDFHYREIRLQGAFGRGNVFADAIQTLANLPINGLISGAYPLEAVPRAIEDTAAGKGVKLMVKPNAH
jgi:threonine dehydrogenase-like Zn-dependent dehydrogenase